MTFTHEQLVEAAKRWLWKTCSVVITEMTHQGGEEPDAIGWHGLQCILVECKASMADFRADALKYFRITPELGMGQLRYYCAPKGLLSPVLMPPGWGLLSWDGDRMRVIREATMEEVRAAADGAYNAAAASVASAAAAAYNAASVGSAASAAYNAASAAAAAAASVASVAAAASDDAQTRAHKQCADIVRGFAIRHKWLNRQNG